MDFNLKNQRYDKWLRWESFRAGMEPVILSVSEESRFLDALNTRSFTSFTLSTVEGFRMTEGTK